MRLLTAATTLLLCLGAFAQPATAPDAAPFELPAELAYDRPVVFDDENATTLWLDAAALLQAPDDPELAAFVDAWLDPRQKVEPTEAQLAEIDRWLDANQFAFEAYEKALDRPALLPERHEELAQFYAPLTMLVELERVRSRRLVAQDKMVESADALVRAMRLADQFEHAHGPMVAALFSQTLRARVYSEILYWFDSPGSLSRTTQKVVDVLAKKPPQPERWKRAIVIEYHTIVAKQLDIVAAQLDTAHLRQQMIDAVMADTGSQLGPAAREQLAAAIERNQLYDPVATRSILADIYGRIARLQMNFRRNDADLAADIAQYSEDFEAKIRSALQAFDEEPDADAATVAERLAVVDDAMTNVIGRRLIRVASPESSRELLYGGLARHRMMTVAAALKMFELRHRTLPDNMADAIDLGAPPEMLYDPRDGREFTYDKAARTLRWNPQWDNDPARPFMVYIPALHPDAEN